MPFHESPDDGEPADARIKNADRILGINFQLCHNILTKNIISENTPQGGDAVFPVNFLAFVIGPAAIGNADLIDPPFFVFCNLCREFRLKTKTFFFEIDRGEHFTPKYFVTCFHVC